MDSNQTNVEPVAPPNIKAASSGGDNNKMVWTVVAVVVILIIGGIYFFMNSQKSSAPTGQTSTQTTKVQENLDDDLNAIEIGDLDKEFSDVDKDLETL